MYNHGFKKYLESMGPVGLPCGTDFRPFMEG